ncbi:MAG TPA: hypothetical protein VF064_18725 [Pyrinomonadaceae bacterium]
MRERNRIIRHALFALAAPLVLGLGTGAGAQTASTTYKGMRHDPFTKYKPPVKRLVEKKAPGVVAVPPIQTRIDNYKAQRVVAMSQQRPAPKPTTALLIGEVQVNGIFRTPRGYAAMVEATPIRLSYVIYPGEAFYDGMLVAIEETKLVFRRETRWTDGRREVAVEIKPLRQASVDEAMTAKTAAPANAAPPPAQTGGTGQVPGAAVAVSDDTTPTKDGANSKAVENLNSKVDKLIELLKKQ